MDKETYQLLDTVAKVGLGGIISAVSAFAISYSNHKKESAQKLLDDKRTLIKETIIKLGQTINKLKESAHPLWELVVEKSDEKKIDATKNSLQLHLEGMNLLNEVNANSILLGMEEVSDKLSLCIKKLEDVYQKIAIEGAMERAEELNKIDLEVHQLLKECLKSFSLAYNGN